MGMRGSFFHIQRSQLRPLGLRCTCSILLSSLLLGSATAADPVTTIPDTPTQSLAADLVLLQLRERRGFSIDPNGLSRMFTPGTLNRQLPAIETRPSGDRSLAIGMPAEARPASSLLERNQIRQDSKSFRLHF